jgi:hypothetical protein
MAAGAEASGGPALFPFLTDGETRRLGRHFANCVKLGEWELVSEPLRPSVAPAQLNNLPVALLASDHGIPFAVALARWRTECMAACRESSR